MPIDLASVSVDRTAFIGNRYAEILLRFPCPQRVLVVADGALGFGTNGFGLSEFVGILRGGGHSVSTAHRSGDGAATLPGPFRFDSAATPLDRAHYDQLWLFGFSDVAIDDTEQRAVAAFMREGGGVFATGDHGRLGWGMGAQLPRVRAMRDWSGVPMSSPDRLDTVLDAGADAIKQFGDQSNAVPQRTYPVWFSNGGDEYVASTWAVHPLLRDPSGAIDVMPDHPHESECFAPAPAAGTHAGVEEWPAPVAGGARIAPQIVSVSISAGRFLTSGAPNGTGTKPPVHPRSFGGISVYDGDAARVGRIVCDSTWHHFVNINLNGSEAGADSLGTPFTGLYVGGVPTADYRRIQRYYLNAVRWLAPANRRQCWPWLTLALVRFDLDVRELVLPHPHPCPWDPLVEIGLVAEQALSRHWGPGAAADITADMLAAVEAPAGLQAVLRPRQRSRGDKRSLPTLLPVAEIRRALLGSVLNTLAAALPTDPDALARLLDRGHDELAPKQLHEGVAAALPTITERLQAGLKAAQAQVKELGALR